MKATLYVLIPILVITFLVNNLTLAQTKPNYYRTTKSKSHNPKKETTPSKNKKITTFPLVPAFQAPNSNSDVAGFSPFFILFFLVVYFSPTILACLKKRKNSVNGFALIFYVALINTIFGWFCLGWVIAWIAVVTNFFGRFSPGSEIPSFEQPETWTTVNTLPVYPTNYLPFYSANDFSMTEHQVCSVCSGSGQKTCPKCWGRGSWYEQPQTSNGFAQLVSCTYCCASGKIQCTQ